MSSVSHLKQRFSRMAAQILLAFAMFFLVSQAKAQIVFTNLFFYTNTFSFSSPVYSTIEGESVATIVVRWQLDPLLDPSNLGGGFGFSLFDTNFLAASVVVSVEDDTAVSPADYTRIATNRVFVTSDVPFAFVRIPIHDNNIVGPPSKSFKVHLSNPLDYFDTFFFGGGVVIDTNLLSFANNVILPGDETARVDILDDDGEGREAGSFTLSQPLYVATTEESIDAPGDNGGVKITVLREGGSTGRMMVDYTTLDGSGQAGRDYARRTGTLVFDDFQSSTNFIVPILTNGYIASRGNFAYVGCVDGIRLKDYTANFRVRLSNPRPYFDTNAAVPALTAELTSLAPTLGRINESLVLIRGTTFGVSVQKAHYTFTEDQGVVIPTRESYIRAEVDQGFGTINVHRDATVDGPYPALTMEYYILPRDFWTVPNGDDMRGNNFDKDLSGYLHRGANGFRFFSAILPETYLSAGSDYATPFGDFIPPGTSIDWVRRTAIEYGKLEWAQNEVIDKQILIPIKNDSKVEFNEDLIVFLRDPREFDADCYGDNSYATVTIAHDSMFGERNGPLQGKRMNNGFVEGGEQSAGSVDRTFNPDNDRFTNPAFNLTPGANNTVFSVAAQPDGKVVIGGDFTAVNTVPRNRIARLNGDGSVDPSFNPGTGANSSVNAVALQDDGSVIVAGRFTSINSQLSQGIARLRRNGTVDTTFKPGIGVSGLVNSIAIQADGKIIIAGDFTAYNGKPILNLARLNTDGTLDTSFDPGLSTDGPIYSVAVNGGSIKSTETADGGFLEQRISYDTGSSRGNITINYDFLASPDDLRIYLGTDLLFDSGSVTGPGTVNTSYNGALTGNSSTIITLVMNEGNNLAQSSAWTMDVQIDPEGDSSIVVGGDFTTYGGVDRFSVVKVLSSGLIDNSFKPGSGADGVIFSVAKQGASVIVGGSFNTFDLKPRSKLAKLNPDGSLNTDFELGDGFDNTVYAINVQSDSKILVGGLFTTFNQTRRVGMARLNGNGTLDTGFMDTAYNQFAGLPSKYAKDNPISQENFIRSMVYLRLTTNFVATNVVRIAANRGPVTGESNEVMNVSVVSEYVYVGGRFSEIGGGFKRDDRRKRNNVARVIGGSTAGPGNIGFLESNYTVDEDGQSVFIKIVRENGALGPIGATFSTEDLPAGPGAATSIGSQRDYSGANQFVNYLSAWADSRMVSHAYEGQNHDEFFRQDPADGERILPTSLGLIYTGNDIRLPIFDDSIAEGDETVGLSIKLPVASLKLGGEIIPLGMALGKHSASLTIVDNDFEFGTLGFGSPTYTVNEDGRFATIDVTRVGGVSGAIAVDYVTFDGTATSVGSAADYIPSTGTITFGPGQLTNTFRVRINDDVKVEFDETISLVLTNPVGFPGNVPVSRRLDPNRSSASLTIFDNDFAAGRISFTADTYTIGETDGLAKVLVRRTGGNLGDVFVTLKTEDGTAKSGTHYTGVTNQLHWASGDTTPITVTIPVANDSVANADRNFKLVLSDPIVNSVSNTNGLGARFTASVVIANDDNLGTFAFSQTQYEVDENAGYAEVLVLRKGGVAGTYTVNFSATNGLFVTPGVDFAATNAALVFKPGEIGKSIRVRIIDNSEENGERSITLKLSGAGGSTDTTPVSLNIIDDERQNLPAGSLDTSFGSTGADDFIYSLGLQPDGKIVIGGDFSAVNDVSLKRFARLESGGSIDNTFDPQGGSDNTIRDMAIQSDGRILIAGGFTSYNGTNRFYVGRVNKDASGDLSYDPGAGADNPSYGIRLQNDGKSILTGSFASFDGLTFNGAVRLNTNGTPDRLFTIGSGANAPVYATAFQQDGKILLGGDFTTFNGYTNFQRLVRLNTDGTVDTNFAGGNILVGGSVRALEVQPDGKILLGGLFTNLISSDPITKQPVVNHYASYARLDLDGYADSDFHKFTDASNVADGPVLAIAVQLDGKILLGGDFQKFGGANHSRLVRLTSDGEIDPTINFGFGPNATVSRIIVQPDRRILIAGGFTEYDTKPAHRLARLYGGAIAGSGRIEFSAPEYVASESGKKALIAIRRSGGLKDAVSAFVTDARFLPQSEPCLFCAAVGSGDDADYRPVNSAVSFKEGESYSSISVDIVDDTLVEVDEMLRLKLGGLSANVAYGAQSTAVLTVHSDDSTIGFERAEYSVNENFPTGFAAISLKRVGALEFGASVRFYTTNIVLTNYIGEIGGTNFTTTNLVANPAIGSGTNLDYVGTNIVIRFDPGQATAFAFVQVVDDVTPEPNENILLRLTNAVPLVLGGGSISISSTNSLLTIVDDDFATGQIAFRDSSYDVNENEGQAVITLIRTNGFTGVISVDYATRAGTAIPVRHYTDVRGVVNFTDGETIKTFSIPVVDDKLPENDRTVVLILSNPRGGATILGSTTNTLTIIDDDARQGSLDKTFNPPVNNSPTNIVGVSSNGLVRVVRLLGDGDMLIGGEFTNYNGSSRSRIARLNFDGSLDNAFDPGQGPNGVVADIQTKADGSFYLSGGFNTINASVKNRVALLATSGALDDSFNLPLGLNAEVSSIGVSPNGLYIGGRFDKASAANRNHIGRLSDSGILDLNFNPGLGAEGGDVRRVLPMPGGTVIIVGSFQKVNGFQRGRIARLDSTGAVLPDFSTDGVNNLTSANGDINDIAILPNGDFLVAGDFTAYNGETALRIARINSTNFTLVRGFGALTNGLDGVVNSIAVDRSNVYVGGDFQNAGATNRVRLARFGLDGVVDSSFDPGLGPDKVVYSVAVQPDGNVVIGGAFSKVSGESRAGVARLVGQFRAPETVRISNAGVVRIGNTLTIPFGSAVGVTYELQSSDQIVGGVWTTIATLTATGLDSQFVPPTTGSAAFYRIRIKP